METSATFCFLSAYNRNAFLCDERNIAEHIHDRTHAVADAFGNDACHGEVIGGLGKGFDDTVLLIVGEMAL